MSTIEARHIIQAGVKAGWITFHSRPTYPRAIPNTPERTQTATYRRQLKRLAKRRAANIAKGLTFDGRKRQRSSTKRPALKGLIDTDYQRAYKQLIRAEGKNY